MSARREPFRRPGPTRLQLVWLTQLESYAAVRECLTPREQEAYWAKNASRVANRAARELDLRLRDEERAS